jgi:hypothetical protein
MFHILIQVNNEFGEVLFSEYEVDSAQTLVQCDDTFEKLCLAAERTFDHQIDVELKKLPFHLRTVLEPDRSRFHRKLHAAVVAHQIPPEEES